MTDADPVLERVVEQASELLRAQRVGLAVLEPHDAGPVLRFVASRGLSDQFAQRVRPLHWRDGTSPRAIFERRPVWSADILNDPTLDLTPTTRRGIEAEGYRAVLSVPLLVREHILGALVLYRDEPGPFSPEVVELAQVFAAQAAVAIENAGLYRRAEDRATKLHTLSALTQLIVSAATSGEVFRAVAEAATQLLGARIARVWVDVPEIQRLRVEGSFDSESRQNDIDPSVAEIAYGEGVTGGVFLARAPAFGRDLQTDTRRSPRLLGLQAELHAFAALPLITADQVVGVLILLFAEQREFTDEERELMRLLADQAAIAIRQAQLYGEADRRRREAEVLAELASKMNASLELHEVLARVVEGARDLCRADFSRIAVRTPDDPVVRFRHWLGTRARWEGLVVEPGKGIGGRVLATGESFRTNDYMHDSRISQDYMEMARAEGIVAEMAVPVRSGEELQGLLYVSHRSPRGFSDRDEAILRRLADHAGAAITNAHLYQGLRTANEQLEKSQAAIVQNERLRALGEMAAGVAHDFNNLLAVILGRTELLLGKTDDPYLLRGLGEVRRAANDGAATVRRIQNFTGTRRARAVGRVALGDVVREVVELTRVRWRDEAQRLGVQYEVVVEGDVPPIVAHSHELREVFTNLLNNALDAMPSGGRCRFRLDTEGRTAVVHVEDSGRGMTEEVRRRVFEPFFTTKGAKGSGLGLAVSWGIVTSVGGTIEVDSTPGVGTRITVRLPIPDALPDEPSKGPEPAPVAQLRILVIDDDESVRDVLTDMLTDAGHEVQHAENGPDGLARCKESRFDLVITDLSMPGMSGWDIAATIERDHPGVALGLVTGWGEQVDPEQAARHRLKFVLAKPFQLNEVLEAVSHALGAPARKG